MAAMECSLAFAGRIISQIFLRLTLPNSPKIRKRRHYINANYLFSDTQINQELKKYSMLRKIVFQLTLFIITCTPLFADFNPLDPSFRSYMFGNLDPGDQVQKIAVQSDGKIILGGQFIKYNGVDRKNIVRVNPDGTIDNTFDPGSGADKKVHDIVVLSNGKILVAGEFTSYNGVTAKGIVRLNANGSIDNTFSTTAIASTPIVRKIGLLSDGKIILGGSGITYTVNSVSHSGLVRLNTNGAIDNTFLPGTNYSTIMSMAVQSDNKLIISGFFIGNSMIARINTNGTIDNTFAGSPGNQHYQDIKILSDGKILIAGNFSHYKGTEVNSIARLLSNGNLDAGFNPGGIGTKFDNNLISTINTMAIQSDGKIIIAGNLVSYNNTSVYSIARLTANGVPDPTFKAPYVGGIANILSTAVQSDGKILIGGYFSAFANNVSMNFIARFLNCLVPESPVNTTTKTSYCRNDPGELSVSGSGTMKWYTTKTSTTPIHEGAVYNQPLAFASYYVESGNSCAANPDRTRIDITLHSKPVIAASNQTVCAEESITLKGGNGNGSVPATSFAWSDGIVDGESFVPTATKSYTVTGTADNGCSSSATITVTVKPLPDVTATASNPVCSGGAVTLTGGGATTYSWSDDVVNGVGFIPAATKTYTVTGTTNGCSRTASINVEVKPMPDTDIIITNSSLTSAQGNATYQWINCSKDSVMPEEVNQLFFTNDSDEYKVIITLDGCVDSSLCFTRQLAIAGLDLDLFENNFSTIVPNPSNGNFMIKTIESGNYLIVDEIGRVVKTFTITAKEDYSLQIENSGIYFLIGEQGEDRQVKSQKIVVIK